MEKIIKHQKALSDQIENLRKQIAEKEYFEQLLILEKMQSLIEIAHNITAQLLIAQQNISYARQHLHSFDSI